MGTARLCVQAGLTVGICTRYGDTEHTHAAIRLADWLQMEGHTVRLRSITTQATPVTPRWDQAAYQPRGQRLTQWMQQCDYVIWTHCPAIEHVRCANRAGCRTVLFLLPQDYYADDYATYAAFAQVLVCDKDTYCRVQRLGLQQRPRLLPWMPAVAFSLPHDSKSRDSSFVLPLLRHEAEQMEQAVFRTLSRILQLVPEARGTVLVQVGALTSESWRLLREACQASGQRLRYGSLTHPQLPAVLARHSLTLWLPLRSNLGEVGLASLAVGTPLVCFATACAAELFAANCSEAVAAATCDPPSYSELEMLACQVLRTPAPAQAALTGALELLHSRRTQFHAVLTACINPSRKVRK
jgi:hypothetical protein